jgi:uncharacterized protein (DUF58 family)
MPNRFGFVFFLVFLLMLLVGGTYQNNLVFMMAFILLALGLVTIIQTARNIRDLELVFLEVESDFTEKKSLARVVVRNNGKDPVYNIKVGVENLKKRRFFRPDLHSGVIEQIPPQSLAQIEITYPLVKAWGRYGIDRVDLATSYPYGLFKTWVVGKRSAEFFVYPQPAGQQELPVTRSLIGEDFSGHRPFSTGDSFSRVDWKLVARGRGLNTKEYNSANEEKITFEMSDLKQQSIEQAVQWVTLCQENRIEYSLRTDDRTIGFGNSTSHYHDVLKTLVKEFLKDQPA